MYQGLVATQLSSLLEHVASLVRHTPVLAAHAGWRVEQTPRIDCLFDRCQALVVIVAIKRFLEVWVHHVALIAISASTRC